MKLKPNKNKEGPDVYTKSKTVNVLVKKEGKETEVLKQKKKKKSDRRAGTWTG